MSNLCLGTSVICYIIIASKTISKTSCWMKFRRVQKTENRLRLPRNEFRFTMKVVQKNEFNRNDAYVRSFTVYINLSMATVNWKSPRGAQTETVVYSQYEIALRMKLGRRNAFIIRSLWIQTSTLAQWLNSGFSTHFHLPLR